MDKNFTGAGGSSGSTITQTPDDLISQDYVEVILGLCKGPIKGLVNPGNAGGPLNNFFMGDTPLVDISGVSNFSTFQVTQYVGGQDDPPITRMLGGDSSNLAVGVTLLQNIPVIRTTPISLRKTDTFVGLDRLEIRLMFSTLQNIQDTGSYDNTARFSIEYQTTTESTWHFFGDPILGVTGKTTSGYVKDFLVPIQALTNADYNIRVTKLSPDTSTSDVVAMSWESMQMVTLAKPSYPGLAKLHIYGVVTAQFSSLPDMSGVYDLTIIDVPTNYNPETRVYDETIPWDGTFKKAYCNSPPWVLYWLITNTDEGLAHYYNNVAANRSEFYNAAKWCDEQVPSGVAGVTQPRFTFNEFLDQQRLGLELLQYVAGSFNSTIFDSNNGVIRLKTDQLTPEKQIFTPENITEEFQYSFTDITTRYNDITVQFINPDLDWNTDERSATIDATDWINQNGRIPFSFTAIGCTDVHEAIRRANDRLITANTEVTTVQFGTNRFGMLAELYDVILVADPTSGFSTGGRIKSQFGGIIQLRDPIFFESLNPVDLIIQCYSGLVTLSVVPPVLGLVYSLTIVSGNYPTDIPDRTVFTVQNQTNLGIAKPFRVIGITEVEGNLEKYSITALEINVNKYTDSANGTVSTPVVYDYTTPGQPVLPIEIVVTPEQPIVSSDGTLIYRTLLSWVAPFQAYTAYWELVYQESNSSNWITISKIYDPSIEVKPLKDLSYYDFRLFAVSPTGERSNKFVSADHVQIATKNAILENVNGLAVAKTNKGWQVTWGNPIKIPDLAGTRIKYSNPPADWNSISNLYLSNSNEQDLPWFIAGTVRVQAKYINTSDNESAIAQYQDVTVLSPNPPQITVSTGFGVSVLTFTDPTTTQPLSQIYVRKGLGSSPTWDSLIASQYSLGANQLSLTVSPDPTNNTTVMLRAMDVAGNLGAISQVQLPPGANSVDGLLSQIKGDIDDTWLSPALLNHINYGDPLLPGALPDQIRNISKKTNQFTPYYTNDWTLPNPDTWIVTGATLTLSSGGMTLTSNNGDPIIYYGDFPPFLGKNYSKVRVRLRRLAGSTWDGTVFYSTEAHSIGGSYAVTIPDPTIGVGGAFVNVDWDMSSLPDWMANTVSQIRLDFGNAPSDIFEIQYISIGTYGTGITQASFNETITALTTTDQAAAQQLTTLSSSVAGAIGQALNANVYFNDLSNWTFSTGGYALVTLPDLITAGKALSLNGSMAASSEVMSCTVGKTYSVTCYARKLSGNLGYGFFLRLFLTKADGTIVSYQIGNEGLTLSPTWQKLTGTVLVPATVVFMQVGITANYQGTGETQLQEVRVTDANSTSILSSLVQTEATTRASQTGFLAANWTTRVAITSGGVPVIGGISLAGYSTPTQGPTFDFTIRTNKFAIMPPSGIGPDTAQSIFTYYTTATILPSGLTVQPGMYVKNGFIEYVTADQIDTRGLNVKDYSGNILFGVNTPLAAQYITAASNWLNQNQQYSQVANRPLDGQNMIITSSFEFGNAGGWAGDGASVVAISGATWSNALLVVNRDNLEEGNKIPVKEGETIYWSGDLASRSNYGMDYGIFCYDKNNNVIYIAGVGGIPAGAGFVTKTGQAAIPTGTTYITPWIQVNGPFNTNLGLNYAANLYLGRVQKGATLGATIGVNLNGQITSANASTFIANAAINYAMIQYILASQISTTSLSAISANLGTVTAGTINSGTLNISTNGAIASGQSSYMSGIGYWWGQIGGVPKFSIGNPSGAYMAWDGNQILLSNATLENFSCSISGGDVNGGVVGSGAQVYANRTVVATGGKAPYRYSWVGSGYGVSAASLSATCTIGGTADGANVSGVATCFVMDSNNRVTYASINVSATHQLRPDPYGGGGGGGDGGGGE